MIDARDLDGFVELLDEGGVLIGSSGDGRDRAGVRRYLEAVVHVLPLTRLGVQLRLHPPARRSEAP